MKTVERRGGIMASTKNVVLYLTHDSVWIYDPKQKGSNIFQTPWDGNDLTPTFTKILKHFDTKSVNLLLGQKLSEVAGFEVEPDKLNREHILAQAQHVLGTSVSDQTFDWQVVGQNPETKAPIVQVATTPLAVINNISYASQQAGLKISMIKPVAVLLAQQSSKLPALHLLLWNKQEAVGVIAFEGVAYFAAALDQTNYESDIEAMLEHAYEKFTFEINNVIIDWHHRTDAKITQAPEAPEDWQKHQVSLDPIELFAGQTKAKDDQDALTIALLPQPNEPMALPKTIVEASLPKRKFSMKNIMLIVISLLLIGGLVAGGLYMSQNATRTQQTQELPSPSPAPTIQPSPTPVPLDFSALKVEVLNGSGIAGEAGRLADLLVEAGFTEDNIETGNADSYDYAMTEVRAKAAIASQVEAAAEAALGTNYIIRYEGDLPEDSEFDIQIIVGEPKAEADAKPTTAPTGADEEEEEADTEAADPTPTRTPSPTPEDE